MDSIEALGKINDSLTYGESVIEFSPTDIEGECASHVQEIARLRDSKITEVALSATIAGLNNGSGLVYVGLISVSFGYLRTSINAYEKAILRFEELGNMHGASQTYNNLGSVHGRMGKSLKAIEYFRKSLEISAELGDLHVTAQTYNNFGLVYTLMGKWSKAIDWFQKNIALCRELKNFQCVAQAYNNIGLVYTGMGDQTKAIDWYQTSLEMYKELENIQGQSMVYNNLGVVCMKTSERTKAIEYCQKSLEINEILGDVHGKGTTLSNLGKLYLDKDESEPDTARKYLEDGIKLLNKEARPDYPNAVNWLASCYHRIGIIKKSQAKKENGEKRKEELVDSAALLFSDASKLYHELIYLPRVDIPALKVYYHLEKGLSHSVINITEKDNKTAIKSLDEGLKEFKIALKFAEDKEKPRVQGIISEYKAKRYIRRVLSEKSSKKQEKLIGKAIKSLGDSVEKFKNTEEVEHRNVKTCEGCMHLFKALRLFRKGIKENSQSGRRKKLSDSEFELAEARKCYEDAVNELGTDTIQILDKSFKHVEEMIKNKDEKLITSATEEFIKIIEELSSGSLQNMVRIFTFDESMKVPERESGNKSKASEMAGDARITYAGLIGSTIVSALFSVDYVYSNIPLINITDITNIIYPVVVLLLFLISSVTKWPKKRL